MAISPFDSAMMSKAYGDAEVTRLFADSAVIRAMLVVEGALAKAQADQGLIPAEAAEAINRAAQDAVIDPTVLAAGAAANGVVVPGLVKAFRAAVGGDAAQYVHWGATSQDIVDTALMLRLRRVLQIFEQRLSAVSRALAQQAVTHRVTPMVAMTRGQAATPTALGARIAGWGMPLLAHLDRLDQMRPRLLRVSLGGASGNLAAMGDQGLAVADALAGALDLHPAVIPWHAARDGIAECAGLMALITGTLGKMGGDMVLMMRDPATGFRAGAGGGSSTMPHKRNPVAAEQLVHLAQMNAGLIGGAFLGMLHGEERDGAAWATETTVLTQMVAQTGLALNQALALAGSIQCTADTIARDRDLVFAEACSFALARHMPRPEAQARIAEAVKVALDRNCSLQEVLQATADMPPVDWASCFEASAQFGAAPAIADRFGAAVAARDQKAT